MFAATTEERFSGAVGGLLGVRVPLAEVRNNLQLYGEILAGLYAAFVTESGETQRTSEVRLPHGTLLQGTKVISEP